MLQCFKGRCTLGRSLVDDISVMSNCVTKVGRTLKITSVNTAKTSHFWKPFAFSMIGSVWGVIHICIICLCQLDWPQSLMSFFFSITDSNL